MVQTAASQKNIWVASSDGDLNRVKDLIEGGQSPNDKDSNSYTPMHAAASYAHLHLLDYLLSVGGNVNLVDDDDETPLFTVETLDAAKWLVDHGADVGWRNNEGQTAADFIEKDHPAIASYLRSLQQSQQPRHETSSDEIAAQGPSALALDTYANEQASALMEETRKIIQEAEAKGEDPEDRLREVVERAVREGIAWGGIMPQENGGETSHDVEGAKRRRE